MPTPRMVPMLGPDGSVGDVPAENVGQAVAAGGKIGVNMTDHNGVAGVVPIDKYGDAMKERQRLTKENISADPKGFLQSLTASGPAGIAKSIGDAVTAPPQNEEEQRIMGTNADSGLIARGLGHIGLGGYRTLVKPTLDASAAANQSVQEGHPLQALSQAIEGVPLLGGVTTATKQAILQHLEGDNLGAAGTIAGLGVNTALGEGLRYARDPGVKVTPRGSYIYDAPNTPVLSPEDRSAVAITKAVNPPAPAWQQYLDAAKGQIGNVLDYEKKRNLSMTDSRDLAKVAGMAKDESAAHYESNVLGPHENETRPVAVGELAGQNPTLRQIDQRIVDIANDQRSAVRKPTVGQALGASDLELSAEKAHLSGILHDSLGNLTGMGGPDVQALRQRIAQLSVLSGETQGAANAVSRGAGIKEVGAGSTLPVAATPHSIIASLVERIPGFDPETKAAKALIKALRATPIEGTQLPATYPGANAPMAQTPAVAAYQQQLARRMAISNDQINNLGPSDLQQVRQLSKIHQAGENRTGALTEATHAALADQQQQAIQIAKAASKKQSIARFLNAQDINQ